MQIYHHIHHFQVEKPVLTIGAFDGLHLGHRKVIEKLKAIADAKEAETVVFTFHPHPQFVLAPERSRQELRMLTTIDERIALFEKAGIDHLVIFPFTKEFSRLAYADFVRTILVEKMHINTLVLGYDHRLGRNRAGNFESLQHLSAQYGFELEKLDALLVDDNNISSTKIRRALQQGDVQTAARYLGYSYSFSGTVVEGMQLGRKIQFPTANIRLGDKFKLIPKNGVYAVRVFLLGKTYDGMMNIGIRPTVNKQIENKSIEVHLFDFQADIYGRNMGVQAIQYLRDEQKFASVDELRAQLEIDKQNALRCLKVRDKEG